MRFCLWPSVLFCDMISSNKSGQCIDSVVLGANGRINILTFPLPFSFCYSRVWRFSFLSYYVSLMVIVAAVCWWMTFDRSFNLGVYRDLVCCPLLNWHPSLIIVFLNGPWAEGACFVSSPIASPLHSSLLLLYYVSECSVRIGEIYLENPITVVDLIWTVPEC